MPRILLLRCGRIKSPRLPRRYSMTSQPVISNGAGRLFLAHSLLRAFCEMKSLFSCTSHLKPTISGVTIPAMERTFHVYFMASKSGVLYLGVTSNLSHRVGQHKEKFLPGFTKKYNVTKLVWFEPHTSARSAISREKEIKKWRRAKKIALIESLNLEWNDLSLNL